MSLRLCSVAKQDLASGRNLLVAATLLLLLLESIGAFFVLFYFKLFGALTVVLTNLNFGRNLPVSGISGDIFATFYRRELSGKLLVCLYENLGSLVIILPPV